MKICFVNLASGYSGGENQTFLLAAELKRRNIDLIAVTNPKSELTAKLERLGVKTIAAGNPWSSHLLKELKGVTVFHAHDGRSVHWCSIHKFFFKTPFIITRRIDNPIRPSKLTKSSYQNADILVGISQKICDVLSAYTPGKKVEKIPSSPVSYPVDPAKVSRIKERFAGKFIVVQAAKLLEHKGYDVSIQAAKLLESEKDIVFLFLGDGPMKEELTALAKDTPNVFFMGRQTDMGNWFEAADCLILPSRNEGLGSVLLEAMKAEVPVIATDVGGIPDIVKNLQTGLLIHPDKPQELADAILLLKGKSQLRSALVSASKEFVDTLAIENTSEKYLRIYSSFACK